MDPSKLSCWNCKGKHALTDTCPWRFCIFCWSQLVPGAIHSCKRDWVTNLRRFQSQNEYRHYFSNQIEEGRSWDQLKQERDSLFLAAENNVQKFRAHLIGSFTGSLTWPQQAAVKVEPQDGHMVPMDACRTTPRSEQAPVKDDDASMDTRPLQSPRTGGGVMRRQNAHGGDRRRPY